MTTRGLINRDFSLLWIGESVSGLGSEISFVAFPLVILQLGGSATEAGAVVAAAGIGLAVSALPAGEAADRFGRRRIMMASSAVRCALLALLAVALAAQPVSSWLLVAVAFADGVGLGFFEIAERSALPQLVADDEVGPAIARNQVRQWLAPLVGQSLGGILLGVGRAVPFAADALSYGVSVAAVGAIRSPLDPAEPGDGQSESRGVFQGMAWLARDKVLRVATAQGAIMNAANNGLYVAAVLCLAAAGVGSTGIGIAVGVGFAGGVVGATIASSHVGERWHGRIAVGTPWIRAAFIALLAVSHSPVAVAVALAGVLVPGPFWGTRMGAYRLAIVPSAMRGRVQAASWLVTMTAVPIGAYGAGWLVKQLGVTESFVVLALVTAVAGVLTLLVPGIPDPA